jgi:hypothetical protein
MERAPSDQLADHRGVWDRKPVLRLIYENFYDRIAAACRYGRTIEIGGGIATSSGGSPRWSRPVFT